jgi:hypothetical protein
MRKVKGVARIALGTMTALQSALLGRLRPGNAPG